MPFEFMENLPENCPTDDSYVIRRNFEAYRLVKNNPPLESDFHSVKKMFPDRKYKNVCLAKSVSVWLDEQKCKMVLMLPAHRDEKLCKIKLNRNSGYALVNKETAHVSWWPFRHYNIVENSEVINENLF